MVVIRVGSKVECSCLGTDAFEVLLIDSSNGQATIKSEKDTFHVISLNKLTPIYEIERDPSPVVQMKPKKKVGSHPKQSHKPRKAFINPRGFSHRVSKDEQSYW